MTQLFDESGRAFAVTLLKTEPLVVTQIKTKPKDNTDSIQVGFAEKKAKNLSKAQVGHVKGVAKEGYGFSVLKEIPLTDDKKDLKVGDALSLEQFTDGDEVVATAISKAKGFQGVVKRHGFHGGRRSHGQKHSEREPGSIGAGGKQHVMKGMRMAGRMGGDRICVKGLQILKINSEAGEILVKGAIPGRRGTLVQIVG